jgi:DNA polymerase (family 10)
MPSINQQIAAAFAELADLLEMTGGERYRILAYRRAAETLESAVKDVASLQEADLVKMRGIGKATAKKVREFADAGKMAALEEMRARIPPGVRELTGIPGLGPKKAMLLHSELGIANLEQLRDAIEGQRLRTVPGLGEKTEENLAAALARYSTDERRMLLGTAIDIAEGMVAGLLQAGAEQATYAGSVRRMKETIRDLDILAAAGAATQDTAGIAESFANLPQVARVALKGGTKTSVVVAEGLQVDLRIVAADEFGSALQYFTGSKQHNVKVREHAVKNGLKLSEYGLFTVPDDKRIASETEEEVYEALGMQTPLPTMREDLGEVELALRRELPEPVLVEDIRGELHGHSNYSDGRLPIIDMATEARRRGYVYWAVTDHGRDLQIRRILEMEDIDRQIEEVAQANAALAGELTVLHGVELNVAPDGSLDYPNDVLERFDLRVASIHGAPWDLESMTRRLIAAAEHPLVNILGHPSGRRMGRRPAGEFDLDAVFKAAAANQVAVEINSNPQRLDLKDDHARAAREYGCYFAINTDAHKYSDFDHLRLGVGVAQRAWVGRAEVINTWPLDQLRSFLAKR